MCFKAKAPTQTSSASVPAWLDKENQALVQRANAASNTAYTPYTGERVAQYGQDATQGFDVLRGLPTQTAPLLQASSQSALDYAARAGRTPTQEDIQSRMNPYMRTVLDSQLRQLGKVQGAQTAAQQRTQALTSGFGGSRNFLADLALKEQQAQQVADLEGQGLFEAWNQAQKRYQDELANLQAAAGLGTNTAQGITQTAGSQAQALLGAADAQRTLEQAGLDVGYEDFLAKQNFDKEQISWLANILNPQGQTYRVETSTQKGGGQSTGGQIIGLAATALGAF